MAYLLDHITKQISEQVGVRRCIYISQWRAVVKIDAKTSFLHSSSYWENSTQLSTKIEIDSAWKPENARKTCVGLKLLLPASQNSTIFSFYMYFFLFTEHEIFTNPNCFKWCTCNFLFLKTFKDRLLKICRLQKNLDRLSATGKPLLLKINWSL